jgi:hypothetical protein
MDLEGARWFFDHRNEDLTIDELAFIQQYYYAALRGAGAPARNILNVEAVEDRRPPDHFGADAGQTYGQASGEDGYFISDKLSRTWYLEGLVRRYEAFWRWTPKDFERLDEDSTVNRIYSNGEFETFYIRVKS